MRFSFDGGFTFFEYLIEKYYVFGSVCSKLSLVLAIVRRREMEMMI